MFKALKYIFLANTYKRAKNSFLALFISFLGLILTIWIISDLMSVSNGIMVYILLLTKWGIILSLFTLMGYNILKIINVMSSPFSIEKEYKKPKDANKKEYILNKDVLRSKSDIIVEKYLKDLK